MKVERALVAVLIFFIIILGCESKKIAGVPDNLIGAWGTSDPTYADRPFEIRKEEIIFHTGGGNFDTYRIKKIEVESAPQKGSSLYIIHYKILEGKVYKFSFYYDPAGNGAIRFKNQQEILWTKEKS